MKLSFILLFAIAFSTAALAQDTTREQKFQQVKDLNAQVARLFEEILAPTSADVSAAENRGAKVFRLMPRETYGDHGGFPQGGGSFYSFSTGSHHYQRIPQISLTRNELMVGYNGANYGMIADLATMPLSSVSDETPEIVFLRAYKAPNNIRDARVEKTRVREHKADGFVFKDRVPAIVGHSYAVRAVTFSEADVLVAFRIERKDSDGSLIINWKSIAEFPTPKLDSAIKED